MTAILSPSHASIPSHLGRARNTLVAAAVATALGVFVAPEALSATDSATAADLKNLQNQVQQLQRQIDRMQAQQAQQAATVPAPKAAAATPAAANSPSFMAGPVKVTLNGFVELMVVNRDRNEAADWASNFNTSIPYPNSHNYYLSEFHLTERQSRVAALLQGPDSDDYATEAYLETDFGAAPATGNNNESTSFSPRVRHYFTDLTYKPGGWNLLFGQTWSLVTGFKHGMTARQENIPLTIDGQYVPGFNWLRLPQLRLTRKINDQVSVGVSLENPAAQITSNASAGAPNLNSLFNTPGASNSFITTNNITTDYLPDLVAKVAIDPGFGHYEAFVLNRWFRARNITAGSQSNVKSTGTGFGGNLLIPVVPKIVDFQASVLAGKGVGRYGSAQLPDATINPATLGVAPLHAYQGLIGLTVKPTPMLSMYGYAGVEQVSRQDYLVTAGTKTYGYGYGSSLFDNSGCETEAVGTCAANTSRIVSGTLGGWYKFYQGALGNGQVGISDTWIKREIFSGIGGDPNTNINITMISFRYYPFQK